MRPARTRHEARAAAALGGARAAEDGGCEAIEEELRERRVVEALLLRHWPHRLWAGLRSWRQLRDANGAEPPRDKPRLAQPRCDAPLAPHRPRPEAASRGLCEPLHTALVAIIELSTMGMRTPNTHAPEHWTRPATPIMGKHGLANTSVIWTPPAPLEM